MVSTFQGAKVLQERNLRNLEGREEAANLKYAEGQLKIAAKVSQEEKAWKRGGNNQGQ